MTTIFISDLHLSAANADHVQRFGDFLQSLPPVSALYLLGDIFEYWIGDDVLTEVAEHWSDLLRHWHERHKVPIYFMHGNRDFLVGEAYARRCGAVLLSDPFVVTLYGRELVLTHGDTIHIDPVYARFRRVVRHPWVQKLFLNIPSTCRRWVAEKLRAGSARHQHAGCGLKDPCFAEIQSWMRRHASASRFLIHGHTHQPSWDVWMTDGRLQVRRIVLSDWSDTQGHALLLHEDGAFETRWF